MRVRGQGGAVPSARGRAAPRSNWSQGGATRSERRARDCAGIQGIQPAERSILKGCFFAFLKFLEAFITGCCAGRNAGDPLSSLALRTISNGGSQPKGVRIQCGQLANRLAGRPL